MLSWAGLIPSPAGEGASECFEDGAAAVTQLLDISGGIERAADAVPQHPVRYVIVRCGIRLQRHRRRSVDVEVQ